MPKLALKWAFGYPSGAAPRVQPTMVDGRVFVTSAGGRVYSLDAKTGCTYWSYDAEAGVLHRDLHRGARSPPEIAQARRRPGTSAPMPISTC